MYASLGNTSVEANLKLCVSNLCSKYLLHLNVKLRAKEKEKDIINATEKDSNDECEIEPKEDGSTVILLELYKESNNK